MKLSITIPIVEAKSHRDSGSFPVGSLTPNEVRIFTELYCRVWDNLGGVVSMVEVVTIRPYQQPQGHPGRDDEPRVYFEVKVILVEPFYSGDQPSRKIEAVYRSKSSEVMILPEAVARYAEAVVAKVVKVIDEHVRALQDSITQMREKLKTVQR